MGLTPGGVQHFPGPRSSRRLLVPTHVLAYSVGGGGLFLLVVVVVGGGVLDGAEAVC